MSIVESHLYREIHEQPEAVGRLLREQRPAIQELARAIQGRGIGHVVIAARGTSDNAGRYAKYVFGALNGLVVAMATPSLFTVYHRPPRLGNALVVGISQSGRSPDIVAVLAESRRQGALTTAITNSPASELARQADIVVDLCAGPERAVAATKTYTAELAAVALLSALLNGEPQALDALAQVPEAMSQTLSMNDVIAQAAPRYRYMEGCVVIGRGYNYATAFEMALKMKELTYTIVQPYSSADFQHGPMALIEPGFPVFVIAPSGAMQAELQAFIETLRDRQAELVVISDVPESLALARIPLVIPRTVPEWLSPLVTILPGQLFALHLAGTRDFNVDAPRGITKVTETL